MHIVCKIVYLYVLALHAIRIEQFFSSILQHLLYIIIFPLLKKIQPIRSQVCSMQRVVFHSAFPPWRARASYFPASVSTYVRIPANMIKEFLYKILKHGTRKRRIARFFYHRDFNTRGKNQQFMDNEVKQFVEKQLNQITILYFRKHTFLILSNTFFIWVDCIRKQFFYFA